MPGRRDDAQFCQLTTCDLPFLYAALRPEVRLELVKDFTSLLADVVIHMTITTLAPSILRTPLDGKAQSLSTAVDRLVGDLKVAFDIEFTVYDAVSGNLLHRSQEQLLGDTGLRGELVKAVVNKIEPCYLAEVEPVLVLALPIQTGANHEVVAVGTFVSREISNDDTVNEIARLLGLSIEKSVQWCRQQEPWAPRQLHALAATFLSNQHLEMENCQLRREVDDVSSNLATTYEEISVLYEVTQNLNLLSSDEELGQLSLDWLKDVIPAESLAIEYLPDTSEENPSSSRRNHPVLLTKGRQLPAGISLAQLAERLQAGNQKTAVVENYVATRFDDRSLSTVRQLVLVPLAQGSQVFGWMAAINHAEDLEFGTVEASLMGSIAAILGIHGGNISLFHQQSDFLSQMIRALTSAIDAKDPYTCGHSDRVARVSVCLGRHLGCDVDELNKLYMGGLLHDIGKIGINDTVLRKPANLTPEELEHIKLHPQLGYNILRDVKQLGDVLPIVLHHHESWDGSGYPDQLMGEEIPLLARICAVADAFDAMSSDRPYRKGMPFSQVDDIFRGGRGIQWDRDVIDAFFACRPEIIDIAGKEREHLNLDVQQWGKGTS